MIQAEIYVLRNLVTGHRYVGSTVKGKNRPSQHVNRLKRGKHGNSYLQRAWNKYGADNFVVEIIDSCPVEDRWKVEQAWIEKLQAHKRNHGYNICFPVRSLVTSERMSLRSKRSWKNADAVEREKRLGGIREVWANQKHRSKMSRVMAASRKDPDFIAKMQAGLEASEYDHAVTMQRVWKDPEQYEKRSAAIKKAFTPKRKKKYAARMKGYWEDGEYREKMSKQSKAIWTPERRKAHSEMMRAKYTDPKFREMVEAAQPRNRAVKR
jgi:group I intron endonuclease